MGNRGIGLAVDLVILVRGSDLNKQRIFPKVLDEVAPSAVLRDLQVSGSGVTSFSDKSN